MRTLGATEQSQWQVVDTTLGPCCSVSGLDPLAFLPVSRNKCSRELGIPVLGEFPQTAGRN